MSQQTIDDQQLVERYLADQLSEDEREKFEAYFLEHPEVVQQLEIAARIKGGLGGLEHSGELPALLATPDAQANDQPGSVQAASTAPRSAAPAPAKRLSPQPRWYFVSAIAAGLLLAAIFVLRWNAAEPTSLLAATRAAFTDAAGAPLPLLDSYEILRVRGDTYDAVLELPAKPGVIEVRVVPEFEAASYRVRLTTAATDSNLVAQLDGLVVGNDGSLLMYLSSNAVRPGQYRLDVAPMTGAAETSSPFRLNVLRTR